MPFAEAGPLDVVSASVVVGGNDAAMADAVIADEGPVGAAAGNAPTTSGVGGGTCGEAVSIFGGDISASCGEAAGGVAIAGWTGAVGDAGDCTCIDLGGDISACFGDGDSTLDDGCGEFCGCCSAVWIEGRV